MGIILTNDRLIEILEKQPKGTRILIEDSDGSKSQLMTEDHIVTAWERDTDDGKHVENMMMFTTCQDK